MKELVPLAIFSLLVVWLVGSWGAPILGIGQGLVSPADAVSEASVITSTPTPSRTPTPTPSSTPTQTPSPQLPTSTPTPTFTPIPSDTPIPTPVPLPSATPTPELAWQGRVLERNQTGAGTIGVRAVYLKDHPVILHSGGYQSEPQLTGTKPELGDFGTEFGGLGPGDYVIELAGLAELEVTLEPGEFILVEFRQDVVDTP